jgi:hypothetical protein
MPYFVSGKFYDLGAPVKLVSEGGKKIKPKVCCFKVSCFSLVCMRDFFRFRLTPGDHKR